MRNVQIVLFHGLCGCSNEGILKTPGCKYSIKLSKRIAFLVHNFINKFGYVGMMNGERIINPFRLNLS